MSDWTCRRKKPRVRGRRDGKILFEGKAPSDPGALARVIRKRAPPQSGSASKTGAMAAGSGTNSSASAYPSSASMRAMHTPRCRCE